MGSNAKTYIPVSTADGNAWYTANAADKKSYAAKADTLATLVEAKKAGDYYFADQLNVKNAGEADVENVTINFSIDKNSNRTGYYRIALVPVTDAEENTSNLPSPTAKNFFATKVDDADTLQNVYGLADSKGYKALKGTNVATDVTALVKPNSTLSVNVGTLTAEQAKYYNLYVWFEGQDEDCYDKLAGASIPDINFTVTGDTVNQQG